MGVDVQGIIVLVVFVIHIGWILLSVFVCFVVVVVVVVVSLSVLL